MQVTSQMHMALEKEVMLSNHHKVLRFLGSHIFGLEFYDKFSKDTFFYLLQVMFFLSRGI